ncbi:MAG: hypothetical protein LBK82_13435 [Planctomycetaceae bacterium]|nr:hypothetical protein [Planctomycetaceae bacterium]
MGNRSLNGCVGVLADSESEEQRQFVCFPFWSQCRVNRRDPSAKGSPTTFDPNYCV